ncbi:hypothetical protein MACK_004099 [Theileria orientalis]|uniref:Uncharacterized protein n=1 Tax=Theileria orientalis TaxID=68886 RepID=A0A976SJU2_THEOR|nr:hypothetical protein MACK_004099 [Theileria orientalis]
MSNSRTNCSIDITSNTMKFAIFAFAAFWFAKFAAADAGVLDLKGLGFVLWGDHKESGSAVPTTCPLGKLPEGVFLHKTVKHNDAHFTWVKPVHGLVKELKCETRSVWKGLDGELLLDFHFFGNVKGKMFAHVEHLTALGGVAHVFLGFDAAANAVGKAVGLAKFLVGVAALFDKDFLNVKGLPAHALLHHLALHHA